MLSLPLGGATHSYMILWNFNTMCPTDGTVPITYNLLYYTVLV